MRVLLLAQGDSSSTRNICNEFINRGHDLELIFYMSSTQVSTELTNNNIETILKTDSKSISTSSLDVALLRSWGTAHIGATFLSALEREGVITLNPTNLTRYSNSKIFSALKLKHLKNNFPETIIIQDFAFPTDTIFNYAKELFGIPFVYKSNYGTRGNGIRFIFTEPGLRSALMANNPEPYILQEFLGNPRESLSHYRIIVSSGRALPKMIHLTSAELLQPSNASKGAKFDYFDTAQEIGDLAVRATKVFGLSFSGVDIMVKDGNLYVLEVNDSPATNKFDEIGVSASLSCVKSLENKYFSSHGFFSRS